MRIFISAGEPSGDLHGANFIRQMRRVRPDVEFVGFGGDQMAASGCRLLFPLCQLAVMWFLRVLANLHIFLDVVNKADRYFLREKPDAVVLIDYPGLHWWIARRAHFHGVPVFYFVPPQIWAWATWRVKKMQKFVDHVLCTLPFEESWYHERGVSARYIGHPYFDETRRQKLDADFVNAEKKKGGPIIGLLPGSRGQEVLKNLPTMIRTVEQLHRQLPNARFLVACFKSEQYAHVCKSIEGKGLPIEPHLQRTPEIIHLADACVAVSGSVSLELLYHLKPTVVLYRISPLALKVSRYFRKTRYISLVNLLADRELYPEFLTDRCESAAIAGHLLGWLQDSARRQQLCAELKTLRGQVGAPGACERAADYVLNVLEQKRHIRVAA